MKHLLLILFFSNPYLFLLSQDYEVLIAGDGREIGVEMVFDNGDLVVLGKSSEILDEIYGYGPYYFRISEGGEILWDRTTGIDKEVTANTATMLGEDFILGGEVKEEGHVYLERVRGNSGVGVWSMEYDEFTGTARAIISSGDYLYLTGADYNGGSNLNDYDFLVAKVSPDGEMLWRISFGGDDLEIGLEIIDIDDDHILVLGNSKSLDSNVWRVKSFLIDKNGNQIWENTIEHDESLIIKDALISSDNQIYVSGKSSLYPGNVFLAKLTDFGELQWLSEFDNPPLDISDGYLSEHYGNIFLLTTREVTGELQTDIVLLGVNENGNLICGETIVESEDAVRSVASDMYVSPSGDLYILGSIHDLTIQSPDYAILVQKRSVSECLVNNVIESNEGIEFKIRYADGLIINSPQRFRANIIVYDVLGRSISKVPYELLHGANKIGLNINTGTYVVIIETEEGIIHQERIMKFD